MVVLVTGAGGQLGQAIASIAGRYPDFKFTFADSTQANLTDKTSLEYIFARLNPDFCINAAAYTAVDKAESEPEKAQLINVTGVRNLAEVCQAYGTTLLHVSTDFVFDGVRSTPYTEDDAPNPQGIYGQTKLDGERVIANTMQRYFIIRTSWVYSRFGSNFMKTMLRLAAERPLVNVVNDQIGTPTHAIDLAEALLEIIRSGKHDYGIYHFSNDGAISWYDFAREIFSINGISIDLKPIPTTAYPTPAKRPSYSVLDKSKISRTFGIAIKDWRIALKEA